MRTSLSKIISGGQTGADQAGLDVAIKNNISYGGAIPKGRMTERGILPPKYDLEEMPTKSYPKRTEKNVVDSNGTVIFTHGRLTGGSLLTWKKALLHKKPVIHLDLFLLDLVQASQQLADFISEHDISILNVAGSRESKDCLIYSKTFDVLDGVISNKF